MPHRSWAPYALVLLAGCATGPDAVAPTPVPATQVDDDDNDDAPPRPAAPRPTTPPVAAPVQPQARRPIAAEPAADPFGDVGFKEVNEKDWLASLRAKIAEQEKVAPTDLRVSPGLLRAAYVRSPPVAPPPRKAKPGRPPPPRRHEIIVVDNQGRRVAAFRPLTARGSDEPPKDLRFLSEERLVYEVVAPPPPPAPPPAKRAAAKRPALRGKKPKAPREPARAALEAPPAPPPRTFVIQPIAARARPLKCVGFHFTFSRERDHLAYVTGSAQPSVSAFVSSAFVAVDGAQVYPRRGRTALASAPAWSKDGRSLAFLETPTAGPPRLVLLAELDNPTGDTSWDLPPSTALDGVAVFWAGAGKLVVGKTAMRPVFSASFTKE